MGEVFLGVDAGAGLVKACAFARDGTVLGKAQKPVQLATPHPAWAEIDLERYWRAVLAASRDALKNAGPPSAVGIASNCPTTVFLDSRFNPIRPGILYLDRRSDALVRCFAEELGGGDALFRRLGNHPFSSTCWLGNARWLAENEPSIWKQVRHVCLLGTFLVKRMTGAYVLDHTQASFSGGFSIHDPEAGWEDDLLAWWGIEPKMLPKLGQSHERAGTLRADVAAEMGAAPGAVVAFGAADSAAAALAANLRCAGDVLETGETAGVVTFGLERPDFNPVFMNRCHIFPGRWLAHGAMSTLGGAFAWLKNKIWPDIVSIAELELLAAESPPGANGLIFLPYLAGERTPIWDPRASGTWVGLRLDTTRADMIRAVFEGSAFALRQILEIARKQWGRPPGRILSVGGGPRSRFWSRLKREILGAEYVTADKADASAWGAAILGAVAGGFFKSLEDSEIFFLGAGSSVTPSSSSFSERMRQGDIQRKAVYDNAFSVYCDLYPALRPFMHSLRSNDD